MSKMWNKTDWSDRARSMPDRRRQTLPVLVVVAVAVALGGCAGFRSAVGLNKQPPDEFAVVSKAPLVIPPDFGLRPPRPGERRPQEDTADGRAASVIFGAPSAEPDDSASRGELALLHYMGAANSNTAIRAQIRRENRRADQAEASGLVNRILFWRDKPSDEDIED